MDRKNFTSELIEAAIFRLNENTSKIEKCFNNLEEEDIWKRPNASSNSIGNLILHICGNITQYIISSLGGKEDKRDRYLEFSIRKGFDKGSLIQKLKNTVNQAIQTLGMIQERELTRVRSVQAFEYSGIAIIIHVVEHYSYHTGQIIFYTKMCKDVDLDFYAGVDLNRKNE
jgi:uncharacterized damage-inducible protein DinB